MTTTGFKFEGKIQNASKVIAFTRIHTDDADNYGTKNNIWGGVNIIYQFLIYRLQITKLISHFKDFWADERMEGLSKVHSQGYV